MTSDRDETQGPLGRDENERPQKENHGRADGASQSASDPWNSSAGEHRPSYGADAHGAGQNRNADETQRLTPQYPFPPQASQPPHPPTPSQGHQASQQYAHRQMPHYSQSPNSAYSGSPAQSFNPYTQQARPGYAGNQPGVSYSPAASASRKKQKRTVGIGTLAAAVLIAGFVGGGTVAGVTALSGGTAVTPGMNSSSGIEINNPEQATVVTAAAAKASPSVVTLSVVGGSGSGSGSGIILDDEGHVLTNTHVVTLGGQTSDPSISVRLSNGTVTSATIVGTDPLSDLAVIQLDNVEDLEPAELGSSSDLNVGDQAIAIGAPLGLDGTVTDGIVSTLDRTISVASSAVDEETTEGAPEGPDDGGSEEEDGFEFYFPDMNQSPSQGYVYLNVIQTDAAINQGNSGGALVNGQGQIIGVNVAIASTGGTQSEGGSIGVGFSIPIDYAKRVAEELIANGEVSHGLMGVQVLNSSAQDSGANNSLMQEGFTNGAVIDGFGSDASPAAEAGLESGDVITAVDGRSVSDSTSLTAVVREYASGDTVTVSYLRNGEAQETEVTLGGM